MYATPPQLVVRATPRKGSRQGGSSTLSGPPPSARCESFTQPLKKQKESGFFSAGDLRAPEAAPDEAALARGALTHAAVVVIIMAAICA